MTSRITMADGENSVKIAGRRDQDKDVKVGSGEDTD